MSTPKWGGRKAAAWSKTVLLRYGRECMLRLPGCTGYATEADHIVPRSVDLSREYDVTNGRPSCRSCNRRRGNEIARGSVPPLPSVDSRALFENAFHPGRMSGRVSPPDQQKNENASVPEITTTLVRFAGESTERNRS